MLVTTSGKMFDNFYSRLYGVNIKQKHCNALIIMRLHARCDRMANCKLRNKILYQDSNIINITACCVLGCLSLVFINYY